MRVDRSELIYTIYDKDEGINDANTRTCTSPSIRYTFDSFNKRTETSFGAWSALLLNLFAPSRLFGEQEIYWTCDNEDDVQNFLVIKIDKDEFYTDFGQVGLELGDPYYIGEGDNVQSYYTIETFFRNVKSVEMH